MNECTTIKSKMPLILAFAFAIIISSILTFSFSVFIVQAILFSITIPLLANKRYDTVKTYMVIFIISMIFVFLVYGANQMYFGSSYYIGGSDDLRFEQKGFNVANSNIYNPSKLLGTVLDNSDNTPFFAVYIAILINLSEFFDGYSTFIPRIANIYFLLWIFIIFEYLLCKYSRFSYEKINKIIGIIGLTPNVMYINSHVFRDTLNLLQIFLLVYIFDQLMSNKKYFRKILLLGFFLFLIYATFYTRKSSLVFAIGLILITLCERFKVKPVYALAIIIPILMMDKILTTIKFEYFTEYYSNYIIDRAGEGLSSYIFQQPLLPFGVFLRSLYALITPFPNFFGLFKDINKLMYDLVMFLVYCGVLVQIMFIPFITKRLIKVDWLTLSFAIIFLGTITTTFTFRHVLFYYPFMVAIGVDGYFCSDKTWKKGLFFIWLITIIMLGLIYAILKIL